MRRFRRPPGRPIRGGGVSAFAIVLLVALLSAPFTPLIFASVQTLLRRSNPKPIDQNENDIFAGLVEEDIGWRGKLAKEYLKSLFSEKVLEVITANTNSSGPLSLDSFRVKLSESWKIFGLETSMENKSISTWNDRKDRLDIPFHSYSNFTPEDLTRRKLREKRREKRAADLIKQDDGVNAKLENEAIQRAQSGKFSPWKTEKENIDYLVRLMQDQIIMARVYHGLAHKKKVDDLAEAIENRIKQSENALGEATADTDLPSSAYEDMKAMGQVLSVAREKLYDCRLINRKLRAMLQTEAVSTTQEPVTSWSHGDNFTAAPRPPF